MEAQIPITNTTDCKYLYNKNNVIIDEKIIICGGHLKGGKDACRVIFSFINLYYKDRIFGPHNLNDSHFKSVLG